MYNVELKHKAKTLRLKGTSINEIAYNLRVNKSTVSYWCRDIILKTQAINRIITKGKIKSVQALLRYSEIKRLERFSRTTKEKLTGSEMVGTMSDRDILMIGLGLYWGEGYKESNGELGFTNSNPGMIKFYIKWLEFLGVKMEDLIFRLTINDLFRLNQKEIKNFWVKLLNVNEAQFSKTTIIKTQIKKGFKKDISTYNGILRVKVRKGLSLKNNILGAIDHIGKSV